MTYDSFVTAAIAQEAQALVGVFVDHIAQPSELDIYLTFYGGGSKSRWVFSADARLSRVHRVEAKPENPATPPNFCMLLRKWIDGARLAAVRQEGFDRVLRWEFTRSDGDRALIAEVMGKHSNLILVDEANVILGAVKRVPAALSRTRQVLPGLPYLPPPAGDRLDPFSADAEAFLAALQKAREEGKARGRDATERPPADGEAMAGAADPPTTIAAPQIVRAVAGFGPFAAAEVLARAGSGEPRAVWSAVHELAGAVQEGRYHPTLLRAPGEAPRGFWAFRSVQLSESEQFATSTMSLAAEGFYSAVRSAGSEAALRGELLGRVRKERERLERLARRLQDDMRRGEEVEQWKIAGELLAANLFRVERGQTAVEVANYYDPEQRPLKIELNPEQTPQENVERLFRKYRKGTDAALQAMEQSESVAARLAEVRDWESRIEAAAPDALPALREALDNSELLPKRAATPAGGRKGSERASSEFPPGVRIRRYWVDGWEVLLGENATSNDFLTTKVARPDDWWLHVRASPSAHVVIRTGGHPERVPPTVIQQVAGITAGHSESKHSSYVPVDYVLKKYVRKPRGSAPGLVTHRGEKTVYVEPAIGSAAR
jgi:predicted ribosome quality control (RQC) complex YloA/Tae2 family protein